MEKRGGVSRPVREILTYFLRNPAAVDSLEGIVRWRLLEQEIHKKVIETQKALEWLIEEGFLVEVKGPHSGRLFRLNPERQDVAEQMVARPKRKRSGRKMRS